ncbi:MAG: branched-chain amino acid aminotransferase [Bacteroidetes bacterium]|nr:branched-chain amino acid aminotransferase [Bacteroidota bacterium]MDA0936589.1 branched-chain amino acid aminotransferase [Bacteroidota bacterium]
MKIVRTSASKLGSVDFENLNFGSVFTDHMFVCRFNNGQWQTPEVIPYQPMSFEPSMSVLHYGQAVFEGMKAYKDDQGKIWLFRPDQNFKRINRSSERLQIPVFPEDYFFEGLKTLLDLDRDWIKPGIGNSLYIRPFVFSSQACVQASPSKEYTFIIICCPVKAYYGGEVNVLIAEEFSRAANGGIGFTKAAGNYAAQFYPTALAQKEGYQQIVWTDANTHEYLEEAGTMNIFFRVDDQLITAPTNDRILDGVTRKSVIQIARDSGIDVEIRPIRIAEIVQASKENRLKEMFGSGTAVVINPIKSFGYQGANYKLPELENPIATRLKEKIMSIQYNLSEDPYGWRFAVD